MMIIILKFCQRLSRARRVIENTFGIMVARWRIFKTEINANPEKVEDYTNACIVLHKFIMSENEKLYCPRNFPDQEVDGRLVAGAWRSDGGSSCMSDIVGSTSGRLNVDAKEIREQFMQYFSNEGALP